MNKVIKYMLCWNKATYLINSETPSIRTATVSCSMSVVTISSGNFAIITIILKMNTLNKNVMK